MRTRLAGLLCGLLLASTSSWAQTPFSVEKVRGNLARHNLLWLLALLGKKLLHNFLDEVHEIMRHYQRVYRHPGIEDIAKNAREILRLNHQYGEGWLIAGEISPLMKNGISNVLCLQPFGCIANHIVAKGAEKRLREIHPQLNLLFLDADAGISEVNFFNRMHFFLNHARETGRAQQLALE